MKQEAGAKALAIGEHMDDGFIDLSKQRPFNITPDEMIWRLRADWLGFIADGHTPISDTLIPYLEAEAIHRLEKESGVWKANAPHQYKEPERWRLWWLNEACHQCAGFDPIGRAADHLTPIGQAAVNIILAASSLREAIEYGKAEEAAALSILLICEAIQGGYSIEVEAMKQAGEAIERARVQRVQGTIGKTHADMATARKACVQKAKAMWKTDPTVLIGAVAEACREGLLRVITAEPEKLPTMTPRDVPETDTIKGWLRDAGATGALTIPKEAQKRGRPPKK